MDKNCIVLVDGAAGYLGRHVVKDLLEQGYKVRATDIHSSDMGELENMGAETVYADLLNREEIEKAVDGADYVIHCAALFDLTADIEVLRRVNVLGTENILKASAAKGVKQFVHVSSADIYGTLKHLPGDENHPQKPINNYAKSKKEGEDAVWKIAKEEGIEVTVFRPSAIYGPGSIYIAGVFFFWPIFFKFLRLPFYPYIRGGSKLTFTHVDDVSRALIFSLGNVKAFGEVYNIADQEFMYSGNFACKLCHAFGIRNMFKFTIPLPHFLIDLYGKFMLLTSGLMLRILNPWVKKRWLKLQKKYALDPIFVPHFERQFYSYFIGHRYYSSKKLRDLGYIFKNKSFDDGFPGTIQWYIENKWIPGPNQFK